MPTPERKLWGRRLPREDARGFRKEAHRVCQMAKTRLRHTRYIGKKRSEKMFLQEKGERVGDGKERRPQPGASKTKSGRGKLSVVP